MGHLYTRLLMHYTADNEPDNREDDRGRSERVVVCLLFLLFLKAKSDTASKDTADEQNDACARTPPTTRCSERWRFLHFISRDRVVAAHLKFLRQSGSDRFSSASPYSCASASEALAGSFLHRGNLFNPSWKGEVPSGACLAQGARRCAEITRRDQL